MLENSDMNRIKIAILFGTKPNFEVDAFKYFTLALNKIQKTYEFYFPDEEDFPITVINNKVDNNKCITEARSFVYDRHTSNIVPNHAIFIVSKGFNNNYFHVRNGNISVITADSWEKRFSPPSLFEYLLHSIYTCLLYSKTVLEGTLLTNEQKSIAFCSHSETKGCIGDFTRKKHDDKVDITLGYICEKHTEEIIKYYGSEYLKEFQYVIERNWIGSIKKKGSVAYNLKHIFKFDINKDSGFNKSRWGKIKEKIYEEFYKIPGSLLFEIIKLAITVLVTYWLVKWGLTSELK
jgi:hypothetical protein